MSLDHPYTRLVAELGHQQPFRSGRLSRPRAVSSCRLQAHSVPRQQSEQTRGLLQVGWGGVPGSAWAALAWAGLGTSFLAHSGVSWAVGRCSAVVPSIYSCMQVRGNARSLGLRLAC